MSVFEFATTESPAMVSPEEYLSYLVIERVSELEAKLIQRNPEYQKIQIELNDCYLEIRKLSSEPDRVENLIEKIQVNFGVLEVLIGRLSYKQGLKDGAILIKYLGVD